VAIALGRKKELLLLSVPSRVMIVVYGLFFSSSKTKLKKVGSFHSFPLLD